MERLPIRLLFFELVKAETGDHHQEHQLAKLPAVPYSSGRLKDELKGVAGMLALAQQARHCQFSKERTNLWQ